MHLSVSTDMGMRQVSVESDTGPADLYVTARKLAVSVCTDGFWQEDRFFPAYRVNYAEIVKDDEAGNE